VTEPAPASLTAAEVRVLAALAEKEATVPDTYPLTLKALVSACNQTSARDPVVDYSLREVEAILAALKAKGLTRYVHPSHGGRTTRYRHTLDEVLSLDRGEQALLTMLMLRGAQTSAELRSRAERSHRFQSVGDAEATLRALAEREPPLVAGVPRQPGQKEGRWVHLLCGPPDLEAVARAAAPTGGGSGSPRHDRVDALEADVRRLQAAVDHLYGLLDAGEPPAPEPSGAGEG
jgi:uncharacterized protein YceH (UPF0502 family)